MINVYIVEIYKDSRNQNSHITILNLHVNKLSNNAFVYKPFVYKLTTTSMLRSWSRFPLRLARLRN